MKGIALAFLIGVASILCISCTDTSKTFDPLTSDVTTSVTDESKSTASNKTTADSSSLTVDPSDTESLDSEQEHNATSNNKNPNNPSELTTIVPSFIIGEEYPQSADFEKTLNSLNNIELNSYGYRSLIDFEKGNTLKELIRTKSGFALTFSDTPDLALKIDYDEAKGSHIITRILTKSFFVPCNIKLNVTPGGLRIVKTEELIAIGYDHYNGYYYVINSKGYIKIGSDTSFSQNYSEYTDSLKSDPHFLHGEETYSLSVENGELTYSANLIDRFAYITLRQNEKIFLFLHSNNDLLLPFRSFGTISNEGDSIVLTENKLITVNDHFHDSLSSLFKNAFISGVLPSSDDIFDDYIDYLAAKSTKSLPSQS